MRLVSVIRVALPPPYRMDADGALIDVANRWIEGAEIVTPELAMMGSFSIPFHQVGL
uniref:Uncharacterized protein n=1 Tax=Candidatus Kentrum sp. LPFa TaxID=2126335 RepID=A0A450W7G2_9GAMM|nr:MAG: hypothetical protein BECKLPF1236A_GA0070988_1008017 [Candidatus Kentron sp. LPFa]VFK29059.1 MAG: hypothetical protein BECKLPF1236C_GA0070990_1007918 [Candidatus Kentron sp. LPFa]